MTDRIKLVKGDISRETTDAIVNAANSSLLGGGGVDGAIHAAAGPGLLEECRKLGGCETGDAKITGGHRLKARWVIHTVGPIWRGGDYGEDQLLAGCYRRSLELTEHYSIRTIAFPSISTGAYRFPLERAAHIAVGEIKQYLENHPHPEEVRIVCYSDEAFDAFRRAMEQADLLTREES